MGCWNGKCTRNGEEESEVRGGMGFPCCFILSTKMLTPGVASNYPADAFPFLASIVPPPCIPPDPDPRLQPPLKVRSILPRLGLDAP